MSGYADPELLVATWLHDQTGHKVWANPGIPPNWPFTAPLIHVQRGQGEGDTQLTLDLVLLDVDVYSKVADNARQVAEQVRGLIRLVLPHTQVGPAFVTGTATASAPAWAPDPSVFRRTAAYRVFLHSAPS